MPDPSLETIRSDLRAAARRHFGEERAEALAADLDAFARDLSRVAEASLPAEAEPAFFLLGVGP